MESFSENYGKVPVWLIVLIIIIVLAVVLVATGGLKALKEKLPQEGTEAGTEEENAGETEEAGEGSVVAGKIFSYKGEILKILSDEIQIKAPKTENPFLSKDKTLSVKLTEETELSQTTIPISDPTLSIETKGISLENLKVGDNVEVFSDAEISEKTEFTASRIDKIVEQ